MTSLCMKPSCNKRGVRFSFRNVLSNRTHQYAQTIVFGKAALTKAFSRMEVCNFHVVIPPLSEAETEGAVSRRAIPAN